VSGLAHSNTITLVRERVMNHAQFANRQPMHRLNARADVENGKVPAHSPQQSDEAVDPAWTCVNRMSRQNS